LQRFFSRVPTFLHSELALGGRASTAYRVAGLAASRRGPSYPEDARVGRDAQARASAKAAADLAGRLPARRDGRAQKFPLAGVLVRAEAGHRAPALGGLPRRPGNGAGNVPRGSRFLVRGGARGALPPRRGNQHARDRAGPVRGASHALLGHPERGSVRATRHRHAAHPIRAGPVVRGDARREREPRRGQRYVRQRERPLRSVALGRGQISNLPPVSRDDQRGDRERENDFVGERDGWFLPRRPSRRTVADPFEPRG
jgi:hypothetical protein